MATECRWLGGEEARRVAGANASLDGSGLMAE